MLCSLCFCSRLLPLSHPSHSFLFPFTLTLLPIQPEVDRDPMMINSVMSLHLLLTSHKVTFSWPSVFPLRGERVLLWDVCLGVSCGFIGFCGEVRSAFSPFFHLISFRTERNNSSICGTEARLLHSSFITFLQYTEVQ